MVKGPEAIDRESISCERRVPNPGDEGSGQVSDLHPTAERFLFIDRVATEAHAISVVLNWFEELKRRVPTGR